MPTLYSYSRSKGAKRGGARLLAQWQSPCRWLRVLPAASKQSVRPALFLATGHLCGATNFLRLLHDNVDAMVHPLRHPVMRPGTPNLAGSVCDDQVLEEAAPK
jgi:hypothetical protein